jgi:lysosomal alpha-mannosidase
VAHTHDDVGWIKTVDQYFSGTNQDAQHANVRLILDTVVDELLKDPKRVFTYVEMKFFTMWYWRQTPERQKQVKQLVKEGRLEFANGGWSATDEACPNYEDIINNMMKGHAFLKKEFGVKPRVGWHIDAFGHSSANARLFADFGFEAQFFARNDR